MAKSARCAAKFLSGNAPMYHGCGSSPSLRRGHRSRCGLSLLSPSHWTTANAVVVVVVVVVEEGENAGWRQATQRQRKLCTV